MIVICKECGKNYRIDAAKMKENKARFKCTSCGCVITVSKQEENALGAVTKTNEVKPVAAQPEKQKKPARIKTSGNPKRKPKRIGLRTMMALLFVFIPVVLIASAGVLYLWQLDTLASDITTASSKVVTQMAENIIQANARTVAKQCNLYLMSHSKLTKGNLNRDNGFRKIAVQKVGTTGYSCLYSVPDKNGLSSLWVHPNSKLIGVDLPKVMRKPLGEGYDRWWKIYRGAYKGKESKGYYLWKDADGHLREKFMVCTPIKGTPYVVASTTYLDEFTQPVTHMEARAKKFLTNTRNTVFGIMGGTLILIISIVSIYGTKLTGRIKSLTDVADRISVGELDAEIEIKSKDELGDLAEAISRMQDSIRLSIERLRRRR